MCKKRLLLLAVISLFLFTGCFEFVEEISFNKDGSGTAMLTINLSKSKTKIASLMLLDSVNGYKIPSKTTIKNKLATIVEKIKITKGVHNVKSTLNFDEFIVTLSCDFDNVDALNTVLSTFSSKKQAQAIKKNKHFIYNKTDKTFVRSHHFNLGKEFQNTKMKDRKVFETATYTGVYRFDGVVKSCTNKQAKISKSKKAVMLRIKAQDIITNKQTIKNKIQLNN
ncbi:hypothetical protein PG911_17355 [Tenacibaculum ovolyticum]|uniref:hypothetical protein n=1 Tax=Tenacibaculum ovolyticum TaxID=104270 RepID=UPI0022F39C93|nr:hypothetical protein [Tenacibaculum ovolyticum]WBX76370.1 hypothetical protein PG911_17355 [Tenacibaculum ovolyticum]